LSIRAQDSAAGLPCGGATILNGYRQSGAACGVKHYSVAFLEVTLMNTETQDGLTAVVTSSSEQISKSAGIRSLLSVTLGLRRVALVLAVVAGTPAVEAQGNVVTEMTHYDAGTLTPVADGTTVTQLNDISGNNNYATALCANMTETLAPLFITVEGQEGISHGKDHE